MSISCPNSAPSGNNFSTPSLNNCGITLTSTSAVISATDSNPAPGRIYQFYVNGGVAGSPTTGNSVSVSGLPNNGSQITKEIQYSDDGGQTFQVGDTCTCTAVTENAVITINQCGSTLTGSSNTFSWNDPGFTATTLYDFWLGSAPLSNDIYDHAGGGTFNGSSITVNNIPTDGRVIYKTLYVSRSGNFDDTFTVECTCTAADVGPQGFQIFSEFEGTVPFGSVNEPLFESYFTDTNGGSYGFGVETLNNVSIVDNCMRVKFDPNTNLGQVGSTRTIFNGNIPDSPVYCLEQKVTFEAPFDPGGPSGQQTVKIGFGLGGGSDVSGGGGNDPCGYTMRWILRGLELRGYSYAFGRPASSSFGEDFPTGIFITPGVEYNLKMRVGINSAGNADGFVELFINGVLRFADYAQTWMDHTQCGPSQSSNTLNSLIYTAFYGGTNSATQSWWPGSTQFMRTCDVVYTQEQ